MLSSTAHRVSDHTAHSVNERLRKQMRRRVSRYVHADEDAIAWRLSELDREWDIERVLETNASILALTGTLLGAFVDRWFLAIPVVVTSFLLQHALQGWCPPVPIFRRFGFRTQREIDNERIALKVLRKDFKKLHKCDGDTGEPDVDRILEAVRS